MKNPVADFVRVDVFSAKGGVGKTTVAFRMAKAFASKRPALMIDADLAGTCLGDLLEPDVNWRKEGNLVQLVCGRPEDLPDEKPYVYQLRPSPSNKIPRPVDKRVIGPKVLFCPSHAESQVRIGRKKGPVDHAVLQAFVSHESAGGWVGHVIEEVIKKTQTTVNAAGGLAAVVVDHGPGTGALQWAEMHAIEEAAKKKAIQRRAVFITSRDLV